MSSNKKNCKHYEYRVIDGYEVLCDVISGSTSDVFKSKPYTKKKKEEKTTSEYENFISPEENEEDNKEIKDFYYNTYVGCKTQKQIEKQLKRNISFLFYHKMSESSVMNDLKIHLHLYMAFRNMKGKVFHFRVKNFYGSEMYNRCYYYVDGPLGKGPQFGSLDDLIKYYKIKTENVRKQEMEQS
uniref:SH2 domain-containing protein n=1 Tax=Strongyloides venezuelensis TaxID=75913 RepID=A0A0K0FPJ9_STRVS